MKQLITTNKNDDDIDTDDKERNAGNYTETQPIKIQIQGSHMDLSATDTETVRHNYGRHISFDDSCKKDDGDEVSGLVCEWGSELPSRFVLR